MCIKLPNTILFGDFIVWFLFIIRLDNLQTYSNYNICSFMKIFAIKMQTFERLRTQLSINQQAKGKKKNQQGQHPGQAVGVSRGKRGGRGQISVGPFQSLSNRIILTNIHHLAHTHEHARKHTHNEICSLNDYMKSVQMPSRIQMWYLKIVPSPKMLPKETESYSYTYIKFTSMIHIYMHI